MTTTIQLPTDVVLLAKDLAAPNEDAADVIARALAQLESEREVVAAVQEGIDAYERGEYRTLAEFDREFRKEHGISPDA